MLHNHKDNDDEASAELVARHCCHFCERAHGAMLWIQQTSLRSTEIPLPMLRGSSFSTVSAQK